MQCRAELSDVNLDRRPFGVRIRLGRYVPKSGGADLGSGVRGGFPGMLVWISARGGVKPILAFAI